MGYVFAAMGAVVILLPAYFIGITIGGSIGGAVGQMVSSGVDMQNAAIPVGLSVGIAVVFGGLLLGGAVIGALLPKLTLPGSCASSDRWRESAALQFQEVGDVLNHRDYKTTTGYAYFQTEQRERALEQHGANVLAAAAATSPQTGHSQPATDQRSLVGCGLPSAMKVQRITRAELYVRVWSEPIVRIADKLGISDVGLAKACRRTNIPVPERSDARTTQRITLGRNRRFYRHNWSGVSSNRSQIHPRRLNTTI